MDSCCAHWDLSFGIVFIWFWKKIRDELLFNHRLHEEDGGNRRREQFVRHLVINVRVCFIICHVCVLVSVWLVVVMLTCPRTLDHADWAPTSLMKHNVLHSHYSIPSDAILGFICFQHFLFFVPGSILAASVFSNKSTKSFSLHFNICMIIIISNIFLTF